jgi:hypothetical protein
MNADSLTTPCPSARWMLSLGCPSKRAATNLEDAHWTTTTPRDGASTMMSSRAGSRTAGCSSGDVTVQWHKAQWQHGDSTSRFTAAAPCLCRDDGGWTERLSAMTTWQGHGHQRRPMLSSWCPSSWATTNPAGRQVRGSRLQMGNQTWWCWGSVENGLLTSKTLFIRLIIHTFQFVF